jgi:hypothetical protein
MAGGEHGNSGEPVPSGTSRAPNSGIWARPSAADARRQEGPLGGLARLPSWLGWCAALVLFVGVAAIALGTLLHLTRELVDLGHPSARALVEER